jgi:Spy/CpxP family protein refolding chaperone
VKTLFVHIALVAAILTGCSGGGGDPAPGNRTSKSQSQNDFDTLLEQERQRIREDRKKLDAKAAKEFRKFREEIDAMPPGPQRDEAEAEYRKWLMRYNASRK